MLVVCGLYLINNAVSLGREKINGGGNKLIRFIVDLDAIFMVINIVNSI